MTFLLGNLDTASRIINTVMGGVRIAQSAVDIHEAATDPTLTTAQKAHRIGTDVLMIGAQGVAIGANHLSFSANARLCIHAVAGFADIAKQASLLHCKKTLQLNDWLDLGCTVLFRVSHLLDQSIELKPAIFGRHLEGARYAVQGMTFLYAGVQFSTKAIVPFIRYLQQRPRPAEFTIVLSRADHRPPELRVDEQWQSNMLAILRAENIESFAEIPDLFQEDVVLSQFRCPLSAHRPIRDVLVLQGTENLPQPVYYERKAILGHLRDYPNVKPAGWPDHILFSRDKLIKISLVQNQINQRLQLLLDDFKQSLPRSSTPVQNDLKTLLQEVGIAQAAKSDVDVVDIIYERVSRAASYIQSITVNTIEHIFSIGAAPKSSRKITVLTVSRGREVSFTDDQQHKIFLAFAGSRVSQHKQLLEHALKSYQKMEFYISKDLEISTLNWS